MKTKTIVVELSQEEISDLLSTACDYGDSYLGVSIKKSDYYGTELEDEEDFVCDRAAKLLLNGKSIFIRDYYAESEDEFYGNLPHRWSEKRECMIYTITLEDVKIGIAKALDSDEDYIKEYIYDWVKDGSFDITEAECVLQYIVFGEVIYG